MFVTKCAQGHARFPVFGDEFDHVETSRHKQLYGAAPGRLNLLRELIQRPNLVKNRQQIFRR